MKKILLLFISTLSFAAPVAQTIITTPLHVKVYSNPSPPFRIDENEKPVNFKPLGDPYGKYSWIYTPHSKPTRDKQYILVGYSDTDKNDILNKGVYKILSNPLFLCTAPLTAQASAAPVVPQPVAPTLPLAVTPQVPKPASTLQVMPSIQSPAAAPALIAPQTTTQNPIAAQINSSPIAAQKSTAILAPQIIKEPELTLYSCAQAAQTGPDLKNIVPSVPTIKKSIAQPKKLLLELKMICSNDTAKEVTTEEVEKTLPSAKVYGNAFDLKRHKKCHFIANDYDNNTQPAEMQEMMKQIYYAIKGPDNIFN